MDILLTNGKLLSIHSESVPRRSRSKARTYSCAQKADKLVEQTYLFLALCVPNKPKRLCSVKTRDPNTCSWNLTHYHTMPHEILLKAA